MKGRIYASLKQAKIKVHLLREHVNSDLFEDYEKMKLVLFVDYNIFYKISL